MPVWKNAKGRTRAVGLLLATWLSLAPVAHAEFKVADVQSRLDGEALVLNGNLEFALSSKVEEALSKGIELSILVEVRLYKKRSLWWDERLAEWSLRRTLQYHALSGQYLVTYGSLSESFLALGEALKYLGTLSELRLPVPDANVSNDGEYAVKLRTNLDIEALPAPLRPVAYTTPSWHLNSGWSAWNVTRSAH